MARLRAKVENKTLAWNANMRPRVGSATEHNGFYYTNITGRNSEPGSIINDWVKTGTAPVGGMVRIAGYAGYLTDTRNDPDTSLVKAGYFLYGEGQFYPGEYCILMAKINNPAVNADVEPILRYLLPSI